MQRPFMSAGRFIDGFQTNAYGTRAYKVYTCLATTSGTYVESMCGRCPL